MSDNIHAQAVSNVEEALKLAGIAVAGFSGAVVHEITEDTSKHTSGKHTSGVKPTVRPGKVA